jgi:hypothetical protein
LVVAFVAAEACAAAASQKTFASPEDAASALVQAVKSRDRTATLVVLGNPGEWMSSGDATADRAAAERFVAAYEAKHAIARDGDKATLTIGEDGFPFAFPIIKNGDRWRFDTTAGREELLARRIGANELDTIKVLQAIVDAEREYASQDRNGDGVFTYAQKFESALGKHDGLYWPTKAGEAESPLGPLIANAAAEGYKKSDKGPTPYHGYNYRMLKGQGKNAESGAFDYVLRGRGIGGFAVVAYPAKYGNSGIMTFIVNQDGKIYQADWGDTAKKEAARGSICQRVVDGQSALTCAGRSPGRWRATGVSSKIPVGSFHSRWRATQARWFLRSLPAPAHRKPEGSPVRWLLSPNTVDQSPTWDLVWILNALWLAPLVLLLARGHDDVRASPVDGLFFVLAVPLWFGHRVSSAWLAYATPAYRGLLATQRLRFVVAPLVIAVFCFAALLAPESLLPIPVAERVVWLAVLDYLLVSYHFAAQHFGLLSLYRSRAGRASDAVTRRLDRWFALVVGGGFVVLANALAGSIAFQDRWIDPLLGKECPTRSRARCATAASSLSSP